jgi:hypothetical protein
MKLSVRTKSLALAVAAGGMLVVPMAAAPAGAALKPTVTCKAVSSGTPKIVGTNITLTSTLSNCTPASLAAGATETIKTTVSKVSGSIKGTMTWKNKKGTTAITIKFAKATGNGKCKAGTTREKITGTTGASTGVAKIIKLGEPVTASICAYTSGPKLGQSSIEPTTTFKL